MKKFLILTSLFLFALLARAEALPPQTAFCDEPVKLHVKPDDDSKYQTVRLPEEGAIVESAVRKDDDLWYKVKVDGHAGWIEADDDIYLKMGPASKAAAAVYKGYAKARAKFLAGKGPGKGWEKRDDVEMAQFIIETWASKGAVVQVMSNRRGEGAGQADVYFTAKTAAACKQFLGFPAVGMTEKELRAKMGHPTGRYARVLRYEVDREGLALSFHLDDEKVDRVTLDSDSSEGEDERDFLD